MAASAAVAELNINSQRDLDLFLKAWLLDFLENAQPEEHCLVDLLLSKNHITDHNVECMRGPPVRPRRDLARKVWFHLTKIRLDDFIRDIAPHLMKHYHHLVPDAFRSGQASRTESGAPADLSETDQQVAAEHHLLDTHYDLPSKYCIRHRMQQTDLLKPLADVLFSHNCIDLDLYQLHTGDDNVDHKTAWKFLFHACTKVPRELSQELAGNICKLLPGADLTVANHIVQPLRQGFPCTCKTLGEKTTIGSLSMENDSGQRNSRSCPDPDVQAWAKMYHIPEETVQLLRDSKFETIADLQLLKLGLTAEHFRKESNLRAKDFAVLMKAVDSLSAPRTPKTIFDFLEPDECLRILLLGKTGSGKSSTANSILGEAIFTVSMGFNSETQACCFMLKKGAGGKIVEVMDSPGLFDTQKDHDKISEEIVQAVVGMHPGPDAILCTIAIGSRYTDEDFATFQRLKVLFDDSITGHMIVVFTNVDKLGPDQLPPGMSPEQYVTDHLTAQLQQVLEECGNRFLCFANGNSVSPETADQQLSKLVAKVREVRGQNHHQCYICPRYSDIAVEVEREITERTKVKQQLSCYSHKRNDSGFLSNFDFGDIPTQDVDDERVTYLENGPTITKKIAPDDHDRQMTFSSSSDEEVLHQSRNNSKDGKDLCNRKRIAVEPKIIDDITNMKEELHISTCSHKNVDSDKSVSGKKAKCRTRRRSPKKHSGRQEQHRAECVQQLKRDVSIKKKTPFFTRLLRMVRAKIGKKRL